MGSMVVTQSIAKPCKISPKKEENTMNDFRVYLNQRLNDTSDNGVYFLEQTYNLVDDEFPKTAKEFVERIQAGKFVLPGLDAEGHQVFGMGPFGIIFRDPTKLPDKAGYNAALKELLEQRKDALDVIKVLPEADALNAFKTFQTYVKSLKPVTPAAPTETVAAVPTAE